MFLLGPLLSKLCRKAGLEIPKLNWLYLTLPLDIVTHFPIGKITPLTKNFIDADAHYAVKLVVIAFLVIGYKKYKAGDRYSW